MSDTCRAILAPALRAALASRLSAPSSRPTPVTTSLTVTSGSVPCATAFGSVRGCGSGYSYTPVHFASHLCIGNRRDHRAPCGAVARTLPPTLVTAFPHSAPSHRPAMAVEPASSQTGFLPAAWPVSFRASAWPRRRNPRALHAVLTVSLRSACSGFADRRRDHHVAHRAGHPDRRPRQRAVHNCRQRRRRWLLIVDLATCRCSSPPRLSRPSCVAGRTAPGAAPDLRDGASAKPAVTSLDTSSARCVGTALCSNAAAAPVRRLRRR